jgi:nucleoside-diphosphate-sugar epimerase
LAEGGRLRRLVQVSTRSVFGRRPATDEAIAEDSAYMPVGVYGASKAAGEVGLLCLSQELGLDAVVARITGVFGPWQGPRSPVAAILEAAAHRRPLRLEASRGQAYEMTYVKDTVRGIATLLHAEHPAHSLYHLSSGTMATLADLAAAARSAAPGLELSFSDEEPPGTWRRTPLAVGRAVDDLEFRARWTLDDAVADAIRAERSGVYGREVLEDSDVQGGVVV